MIGGGRERMCARFSEPDDDLWTRFHSRRWHLLHFPLADLPDIRTGDRLLSSPADQHRLHDDHRAKSSHPNADGERILALETADQRVKAKIGFQRPSHAGQTSLGDVDRLEHSLLSSQSSLQLPPDLRHGLLSELLRPVSDEIHSRSPGHSSADLFLDELLSLRLDQSTLPRRTPGESSRLPPKERLDSPGTTSTEQWPLESLDDPCQSLTSPK